MGAMGYLQRKVRVVSLAGMAAVWAGTISSARGDNEDDDDDTPTAFATVRFTGATIGLTKADGGCWDPGCKISPDDLARFREGAAKVVAKGGATGNWVVAAAGVLGIIGSFSVDMSSKPDPTGTVELLVDGQAAGGAVSLPKVMNTYTPLWSLGPWNHVPLDHDVRLQVHLEDYDWPASNDQIGTVEINSDDLIHAARLRKVLPVYVGSQSQEQLMFVNVSVAMESGSELPPLPRNDQ